MPSPVADAIVVGAGIIGASVAWRLSQAGLRVTLLDAGVMGGEASWAGAGMLAPGGEVDKQSEWARQAVESLRLYPAFVAELEEETGVRIDYRQCGAVEIALNEVECEALLARAGGQRQMRIESVQLGTAELCDSVPLIERQVTGALFYPEDAVVDARNLIHALRMACCARGVQILEQWRAECVNSHGAGVEISGANGALAGRLAVIAAGAWSGQIAIRINEGPQTLPPVFPVRGHLIGYHLEPNSLRPILRHGHTYVLQRGSGLTIAGTSVELVGFDRRLDPWIVEDIARRAEDLLPSLCGGGPPEAWLGFRPGTAELQPEVRRLGGSNIWLAYGHFRNGILLAPITAKILAENIGHTNSGWG